MARFVAQASAERAELQVNSVEVEVPAEILRLGFEFADTPGIGSAIEVNTATTARFLPQADAVSCQPQVFGLSALEALQASLRGDRERMAASGVLALRAALVEFLTTGKAKTYLRNVAARYSALVTDEESQAHSNVLHLLAGQPALARHGTSEIHAGSKGRTPGK